jgi:hypothetical protein
MNRGIKFAQFQVGNVICLVIGTLLAGCARHREFSGPEQRTLAMPPAFLTGPMALLLTNVNSYRAQITFETQTSWGSTQIVTGNFSAAGSKLAFEPELPQASRKNLHGRMVFVWDAVQGNGYALNDALQGYAPYSGTAQFTNMAVSKPGIAPKQIAGHECEAETANVFGNDGSTNILQVWRAEDLRGFPLQIGGGTNSGLMTFSKIQFGPPAEFLMTSEGFTKYESPDAMVAELVARQHNLSRKPDATFGYPANVERQSRPGQPY